MLARNITIAPGEKKLAAPCPRYPHQIEAEKLAHSPPRAACLRATPTRSRSPDADGIPRTPPPLPPGERPKAPATPAKAVARAPPGPLRHPRTTARSSYPPPLPLQPSPALAIRGFLSSSRVPISRNSVVPLVAIPRGEPVQSNIKWVLTQVAPTTT